MRNFFTHVPLIPLDNTLQLFPFPSAIACQPNSSMIPKLDEDSLAVEKTYQYLVKSLQNTQILSKKWLFPSMSRQTNNKK
jgi:hypothetical protein